MKQIILITDGCSNVGLDPVIAAAQAKEENIVVNVIGVLDQGEIGELGASEIGEIAKAGGGLSRIVSSEQLSKTVQMMTRKTVVSTIQQAVHQELKHLLGSSEGTVEELPPEKRCRVVQVMEDLTETVDLKVALLVDASASMKPKMAAVQEAVRDLMLSLKARTGGSELSVFHFPGNSGRDVERDLDWTKELAKVPSLLYKINMKGTTPTGPALLQVVRHFAGQESAPVAEDKGGMWSEYVV